MTDMKSDADVETDAERITLALLIIWQYGAIDGAHHKQWVLDQVVRILADDYGTWVAGQNQGEDGPDTYAWSEGIAP